MATSYRSPVFPFVRPPELAERRIGRHGIVVVGAGPVGLTLALDLARRGVPTVVIDEDEIVSTGSRAICWAKRTLEIFDRLGVAERLVERGITWNRGRIYWRNEEVWSFDLQPEGGHRMPAFINLQQYHVEEMLVRALAETGLAELRWKSRVVAVRRGLDGTVRLTVETPEGQYRLDADWVIAADGVRSPVRRAAGLDFKGRVFEERFLITDVRMKAPFPSERWFWFDPPFHPGRSALLHHQADDIWRIDLQLGPDADPELERQPERVLPRIRQMLGPDVAFELEWVSVYTFQCRRMERFRHGRLLFAGDAAHTVSPFGARGGNGGIQDADNLAWKLALVVDGVAPEWLLDSYDAERVPAADENIVNSTRSTDFMTPKSPASRTFREAVLGLARRHGFARRLVNSGRLSLPHSYGATPLSTPDEDAFVGGVAPGGPAVDAPVRRDGAAAWLLREIGHGFTALVFLDDPRELDAATRERLAALARLTPPIAVRLVASKAGAADVLHDAEGLARRRYEAEDGTVYLMRPDQHVAARWRRLDTTALAAALDRAVGRERTLTRRAAGG